MSTNKLNTPRIALVQTLADGLPELITGWAADGLDYGGTNGSVALFLNGPKTMVNFIYEFVKNTDLLLETQEWDEEGDWTMNGCEEWTGSGDDYECQVPAGCVACLLLLEE